MSLDDAMLAVRGFFVEHGGAGLRLPAGHTPSGDDGWRRLTATELRDSTLLLELDGLCRLTIAGPVTIDETPGAVRLSGYSSACLDWREFGSARSHHEEFTDGPVEFVDTWS